MFHKIERATPSQDKTLSVMFENGKVKKYDMKPVISNISMFQALSDDELFRKVKVDTGGYGISWNDEIDISSEEVWQLLRNT